MEVIQVMSRFAVVERASIDEAYMDLTVAVQQRLKDMTDKQIKPHLLKTTCIQGYPHNSSEGQEEAAENAIFDKGKQSCNLSAIKLEILFQFYRPTIIF